MSTYMFITKEERNAERVKSGKCCGWSCSKTTRAGDSLLVYVAGAGVSYEWRSLSDVYPDPEWSYCCDVEFVRGFDPPVTIQRLRETVPADEWSPPHQNFRSCQSLLIPPRALVRIRALLGDRARTLSSVERDFSDGLKRSLTLTGTQRAKSLSSAPRQPEQVQVITTAFIRNPDVAAAVLTRAGGRCEGCRSPAPFSRASDKSPYLEVHHRIRLADGGEDTVDNALALCPNCHRKSHYGKP